MIKTQQIARVLVVDDKSENLCVMKRILSRLPVTLDLCQSGEEALGLLIRHRYAVAILDVQMPVMDGFELAEVMSHNKDTDTIPIIFVTAINKEEHHKQRGYLSGAVDYLCKPFVPEILTAKVDVFIKLHQQTLVYQHFHEQQTLIFNEITDGWWEWEVGSKQFFYSDNFKQTLGYAPHELANRLLVWQDLVNAEDLTASNQLLERHLMENDIPYQIMLRFRHKKGHTVWMLCRGGYTQDIESKKIHMIGTYTDVSSLKKIEAELLRSNNDLEQFAYIASHDLRAPLRGIESLITWIEEEKPNFNESTKKYFNKLKQRVARMDNLIDGILSYSRISHSAEKQKSIAVDKLLNMVVDMLNPGKQCQITVQEPLPTLMGSEVQLKQIFSNLIGNAIKYNDKATGKITIACYQDDNTPEHYTFSIADNGPGIEKQYHEKIFGLFQTLQPRDKIESTGVGLTVVKKVITLNKGTIWLTSTLGEGTTFYFTWPKSGSSA